MFRPSHPDASAATPSTVSPVEPSGQLALDGLPQQNGGVSVRRSSALYGVHAYHTKVPVEAIVPFIEAHTGQGDLVLDPFCGSGMTGVAAASIGRSAILNDLSAAACHIARNYTEACDSGEFDQAVDRVLRSVGSEVAEMYATQHKGTPAQIEYLVWSDVRSCPGCSAEMVLWDYRAAGLRSICCEACGQTATKASLPFIGECAVQANLSQDGNRITREVTATDLRPDLRLEDLPWFPNAPFDRSRPMWRRGHQDLGITSVADFYSRRNLAALSMLWEAANQEKDERLRSALCFSLTAIANRASRRYQWNAKRPTNVLGGTLYVSSLRYEWNVLSLWKRKTRAIHKLFAESVVPSGSVQVSQGSATKLPLADESVDYCFTDPPFGAHIVYSDASLLWEAWLDDLTDRSAEAIVVKNGDHPKSVDDYGSLMRDSFQEVRRVLKPGGHITVVFQASDPKTWSAIYDAAVQAGLGFVEATTLNKGQPSFKQVKGRMDGEMVAETDVVLTFSRKSRARRGSQAVKPQEAVKEAFDAAKQQGSPLGAGALFAEVNSRLLQSGGRPIGLRQVHELLAGKQ